MNNKTYHVIYYNEKTKKEITKIIKKHKLEKYFDISVKNLKKNPECGNKIQKNLWPKKYKKDKNINNLWRYELSRRKPCWRLLYTIMPTSNKIIFLSTIIDVLDHHQYDRLFRY